MSTDDVVAGRSSWSYALPMDHAAHEPGTVPDCPECRAFSYEPGWYRSLREEHVSGREPLVLHEVEPLEIVLPEAGLKDIVVPELEGTRLEDEDH
jgi:hypothetical protein